MFIIEVVVGGVVVLECIMFCPHVCKWGDQNVKTTFQYDALQYNTTHHHLSNVPALMLQLVKMELI